VRIAQVSPLFESVPPRSYGGTERVVSYLTEELVRQGHDVTLFASGDSVTSARLVEGSPQSLRLWPGSVDSLAHHVRMIERVASRAGEFDIIHFHIDYVHFPVSRRGRWPQLTTLHGRLDLPDLQPLYDEFSDMPVVSISNDQRLPLPQADWQATVYHGLPRDLYRLCEDPEPYLVFLGRISPEKRVDRAIEIARRAGLPLKIAAKIDDADRVYFEQEIRSLFDLPGIEFLGEVGDAEKRELLGHAAAMLFPIDWAEPFGLVMIEAMACGTPVVAWHAGSVPEVIDDGNTGYVVDSVEAAVAAVRKIPRLSRRVCRDVFEERFAVDRMARDYVRVYEELLAARRPTNRRLSIVSAAGGRDDA